MSNFIGVTFAEQNVTPSDDAIVRKAILSDGILIGCGLSYSGSTLTMAAGFLMVSGREIRHTAADNWPIVDAASGYARLVMTIDLTQASTEDIFEQISTEIQYASSVNGFISLTQGDINGAGTKYQVALCVVSLGVGGISGIVERVGPSGPIQKTAARATGSSSALALPQGELTPLTLDTWRINSDDAFTFSDGGIVAPKSGTVLICASVYFDNISTSNPASIGPYVKHNGVEVAGQLFYSESTTAVSLPPVLVEVAEGDVLTLHARNTTRDGSCVPNAKATALTVIYL